MRRWIALGIVFLVSLCVFLVALMPAAVVVGRLPALRVGGAPATLSNAQGLWWKGAANVRWSDWQGQLRWQLDWHGFAPGALFDIAASGLSARGWVGGSYGDWRLEQWRASVPVAAVSRYVPQGSATGVVEVNLAALEFSDNTVIDARGTLHYGGGVVSWGRGGSASVPSLNGLLAMEKAGPRLTVTGPQQQELMRAGIANKRLSVQVLRAWPELLGVSQGGNPGDVVFRMSQPVPW